MNIIELLDYVNEKSIDDVNRIAGMCYHYPGDGYDDVDKLLSYLTRVNKITDQWLICKYLEMIKEEK